MRTTHKDQRSSIWTNPGEIVANGVDDNSVDPPAGQVEFYHGTHLAGLVASAAHRAYGDQARSRSLTP